ncbi:MAG: hypothetical protein A2X67_10190 [Ignavibacteria bacterium GWA2_55_11]|nr:MAG: hypothetical protein A2X67_10190 [Ignavibacteria bacterium GWA2_55_11]OGU47282.1 MAG: hypothetical protein A2X68_09090 [Ignavibacteria bacterium GWC2_56_12]OGU63256.1 MAG: hypothetical protein A3C56_10365 [Ignavibacteria bacterium RIFCSPHIGHO2_02_FULL_56_12]OGU70971.1 MAG: hypothetical protein A3H45_12525 [Ignavibacteria bacterium RIFCSPLOWO2_02_FULL_55_14]OGU76579.1 MAG: hypothetical protein A3G43_04655 [Ignavibacteria bacterium RIFCSPLOWO2_12_FULL_56_21]HAV23852.1 hypothetical protei
MIEQDNEHLKAEVRAYWNAHPCGTQFTHLEQGSKEFYEEVERFRYASQPFMRNAMEFDRHKGEKLLEIGCGLGTDLVQFARGGAIVTGVDLTPASAELVRRRLALYGLSGTAQVADAERLPFADGSFDVVYSFGVLHHTPNTAKAVDEVYRVLRPGGKIIIMLYHKTSMHVQLGTWYARLKKKLRPHADAVEDWVRQYDGAENPLGKAYTRGEVRTMFHRFADLRLTTVDPIRRGLSPALNAINQKLFAPWWGFWLVIKGTK